MINSKITLRDHIRETQLFSNRIIAAAIIVALLVLVLISRMIYLQVSSHQHFTTLSQNNRVSLVPIPPTRGLIYDRNGMILAQNLPSFTLELVPEKIDDINQTISKLKSVIELSTADLERFEKIRSTTAKFKTVPLKFRLTEEEVARFSVRRHHFPGVTIEARLIRHYPRSELAVHALGYVGRINVDELETLSAAEYNGTTHIGKNGIEKAYEESLHGTTGFKRVETNAQGRTIRVLEEQRPVPGENLYLTLDAKVQQAAESALVDRRGAVVAIDPRNGEVLALASMPGFDPNLFVNGIDSKTYRELSTSQTQPLFNRALKGRYPPGSTIKPFIGLAGLEYDLVHGGTKINCPGWYMLKNDDRRYRDWKRDGHGETTMLGAIRESCDVYFYDLALNLGIDRIHEFMSKFGFGSRTGVDIVGETRGLLPSRHWKRRTKGEIWYPGETLITGIGQGFNLASPLQLAHATATLANYGLIIEPHLGLAAESPETGERRMFNPVVKGTVNVTKKSNWDYVIESMRRVVHSNRGSARRIAEGLKYRVAGKTGTSQVFGIKQGEIYKKEEIELHLRDHALFVSFAPIKNPTIAVAVIVENGGGGGSTAAPIARQVMDAYLIKEPL